MLSNEGLNSRHESNNSNTNINFIEFDQNDNQSYSKTKNLNKEENVLHGMNSYNSEESFSSNKISRSVSRTVSNNENIINNDSYNKNISKSNDSIKEDYLFENDIVEKVNNQLKLSIDHHPDYLSKYLFTNNSVIGVNKKDSINEPRFPKKEEAPVWKIDLLLNNQTKALIDILDYYNPISSIYTAEELSLNGKENYGHYSIFIREAIYNEIPCYYVCTDIKIYERDTSTIIKDKVMIAYVSTSLHTLNQVTREYIGKCEDQNFANHYILTKYRMVNYKTDKQKIISSIYDENYYNEISKTIIAPHILTEAGEEVLCRILGLILDEDPKDRLLDSIEFISLINDDLKVIKFNIKAEDKMYFFNGIEKKKITEITEERKFNKYLKKVSKINEIEEMKKELEEMKLENSWDVSKSYDYLDIPKKIIELKKKIDQKQEQYNKEEEEEKEEEEFNDQDFKINSNIKDVTSLENVVSIKKSYRSINRDKYFTIISTSNEYQEKTQSQLVNNINGSNKNLSQSSKNSSSYSSKSNLSNTKNNNMESLESINDDNNNLNISIMNNFEEISNSSLQVKDNVSDIDIQNSISLQESTDNDDEIKTEEKIIDNNSKELTKKSKTISENYSNEIENIKKSLSKIFTDSSASINLEKTNAKKEDSISTIEEDINIKKQQSIKSLNSLNSNQSIIKNNSINLNKGSINSLSKFSNKENKSEVIPSQSNSINDFDNEEMENDNNLMNSIIKNNSKINSMDSIHKIENIKSSINIENITDDDIENEIKRMEKNSNSSISANSDASLNSELKLNNNFDDIKFTKKSISKNSVLINNTRNALEKEYSEDLFTNRVKKLYNIDVPKAILHPYIEYDYIHQKGYLQIYFSELQVSFNGDLLKSKNDKKVYESSHLLESPDVRSEYLTVKDKTKNQYTKYINNNPHLKKIISDYLQLLLSKKPKDVYSFTKKYFNNETD